MKKALLSTAVLGALAGFAAGAAAQSNVTLFGILDVNISNFKSGDQTGVASRTAMNDGTINGLNGSRWGLRGSETLGGGLQAGFVLESGFGVDTGSSFQGGRLFGRQAFLFLQGGFGNVALGRQYVHQDYVQSITNPFGNAMQLNPGLGVTNMGNARHTMLNAPRADNVIQYRTPTLGGAWVGFQFAPHEGTANNYYSIAANFAGGPVTVAASYDWNKARVGVAGDPSRINKLLTVGGNVKFGAIKILAGYQDGQDLRVNANGSAILGNAAALTVTGPITFVENDATTWTAGVEAGFGAVTLGANYTLSNYESAAGQELDNGKIALGGRYALSARTFLYASGSVATGDLKDYINEKRVIQIGFQHRF